MVLNFNIVDLIHDIIYQFVKIRISNSNLFIEEDRFNKILFENKLYPLCNNGVKDET